MIILEDLTIQNFMSVRKTSFPLSKQGLLVVLGFNKDDPAFDSNGAGKSTLFEALCWLLFEKTLRGLSGDEIVNLTVGKNTSVVLNFRSDKEDASYRISRYRKHNENKNSCHIFKNGKNITPKSTKDANKMIEDIFQLDFNTFTNSIIFGQGLIKTFSTATDKEKKEILEKMMGLEQIKKLQDKAKQKRDVVKDEFNALLMDQIKNSNLVKEITDTLTSLNLADMEMKERLEEEERELKEQLSKAKETLENHKVNDADHSSSLELLDEKLRVAKTKREDLKEVENRHLDLKTEERYLTNEVRNADKKIKELKAEMDKIASGQGTNCPACGQEITEETIEGSLRHVAVQIQKEKIRTKELLKKLGQITSNMEVLEKQLSTVSKLDDMIQKIVGEKSQIQASIKSEATLRRSYEDNVSKIEESILRLQKRVGKTYKSLIEEQEAKLLSVNSTISETEGQKAKLSARLDKLNFWVDAFGNAGIKSYLLDTVTPFLNKRANYYLGKLAGNTMQINFTTQTRLASGELRDKFDVQIVNSVGGDNYEANSTGERRRVDLAISLALQDLVMNRSNGRLNILLYDEIFDGLDAVGCENVIQLLQEIQKSVESIFVISHSEILKAFFDQHLVVVKEDGETRVSKE
ncbi:Nuclease SbcCD subunit C [compost metagenome]